MTSILDLPRDLVLHLCQNYLVVHESENKSDKSGKYRHVFRLSLTCKHLYGIIGPFIKNNSYEFFIYQRSIKKPDIIDSLDNTYYASPIGNFAWFIHIRQSSNKIIFTDLAGYEYYDGSERYFLENSRILVATTKSSTSFRKHVYCKEIDKSTCFAVHYKANFGEILILTWYCEEFHCYHKHYHVKLTWTEGDVWIGMITVSAWTKMQYRYEVCVDHGGPIIRKESQYRALEIYDSPTNQGCVINDLWDFFP